MRRLLVILYLLVITTGVLHARAQLTASDQPGGHCGRDIGPQVYQTPIDGMEWAEVCDLASINGFRGIDVGPNVYTYVRQNPWTKFDPLGLAEIKFFTQDGQIYDPKQSQVIKDYVSQNPEMKEKIESFEKSARTNLSVKINDRGEVGYDPNRQELHLDPKMGIITKENDNSEVYQSPAAQFGHEFLHAFNHQTNPEEHKEKTNPYTSLPAEEREVWSTREEKEVIEDINEYNDDWAPHDQGDRRSHKVPPENVKRVRVEGPTSGSSSGGGPEKSARDQSEESND